MQNSIFERQTRPVHPGEVIADLLEELDMTQTQFAVALGVSRRTVNEIINGRRPLTVDMAIRVGKAFGNGPGLWLNLQQKVDIWDAMQSHQEDYAKVPVLSSTESDA